MTEGARRTHGWDGQVEVMRLKRQRNDARQSLQETKAALAAANLDLVRVVTRGRLLRAEDFELHIGMDSVTGSEGRVDVAELERRIADLLHRRPELGVSTTAVGGQR